MLVALTMVGHVEAWIVERIGQEIAASDAANVIVVSLPVLVANIRLTWNRRGRKESAVVDEYRAADLLIITDVNSREVRGNPEKVRPHLYDILAIREENLRPTIVTSGESPESLKEFLGPSLTSRINGWAGFWSAGR